MGSGYAPRAGRREGTNSAALRWIAWMAQGGNAADAVATITAWPHPWFHESSRPILVAVRFLGPWGGIVVVKLVWAVILWEMAIAAARISAMEPESRYVALGIRGGLAGLGALLWLAALANALLLLQHGGSP